jgi:hypothetical protein
MPSSKEAECAQTGPESVQKPDWKSRGIIDRDLCIKRLRVRKARINLELTFDDFTLR